ncbi:PREDICTED: uncharacterized protein LOC108562606 [Nicrophorus vespilloides]|uniref:Uncharacterized protein LOC108562606 n=1 Tax=Nicrophorus vespilloides TaxID=110193 RepID=A0ABM1MPJ8_NICVS|nr:PREDICTED: uncharacterized protein LOC108562606 [Nicrophorus vespilloides]XP_017776499.1 PREDICTED: uncharacterized protein LOC108562606 [Nicrophorus vespilloides]XP_017776500.1 PREDICTED: uncharacterized protein LOC108562606 [Nicrophorus vespilloides]
MKGDIISCQHKDIYFLETNTKSESTDLANLFASPTGREMIEYKHRTKLKHKQNPALEFIMQNKSEKTASSSESKKAQEVNASKCSGSGVNQTERTSRRNSIDLYEEAAAILGLTCSQTDDCRCIECQCHYFDFEEEIDFPTGRECVVDHNSYCSIQ